MFNFIMNIDLVSKQNEHDNPKRGKSWETLAAPFDNEDNYHVIFLKCVDPQYKLYLLVYYSEMHYFLLLRNIISLKNSEWFRIARVRLKVASKMIGKSHRDPSR